MKEIKKPLIILFIIYYSLIYITSIIFLCLGLYSHAITFALPTLFLIPIFLTFEKVPSRADLHVFFLIISIIGRFLLAVAAIGLPALIWSCFEGLKSTMHPAFLLVPFIEVISIYIIIIVLSIKRMLKDSNNKK